MKRKLILLSLIVTTGMLYVLTGVLWLGVLFTLGYLIYLVLTSNNVKACTGFFAALKVGVVVILIFAASICARLLFFEVYTIPSSSMEATLIPGDVVFVSKLHYGPRLPSSPFDIPWVNLLFYLNKSARERIDETWWSYHRLAGLSMVEQGDIIVCTRFKDQKIPFIKRCMGVPGEQLMVKEGRVVNGADNVPHRVLIPVIIKCRRLMDVRTVLDSLGVNLQSTGINDTGERNTYSLRVPQEILSSLRYHRTIDTLYIPSPPPEIESWYLKGANGAWNLYNFGPFIIPKKGSQIVMNEMTFALYANTIHEFEGKEVTMADGKFILNGEPLTSYTFENDYYFLMGDNREDSQDSRYYGFVPKQNIIGKAEMILFSMNNSGFNWKRWLKNL